MSPATRFEAREVQATKSPSALIAGHMLAEFARAPSEPTLTRSVVPVWRSRTNPSRRELRVVAGRAPRRVQDWLLRAGRCRGRNVGFFFGDELLRFGPRLPDVDALRETPSLSGAGTSPRRHRACARPRR